MKIHRPHKRRYNNPPAELIGYFSRRTGEAICLEHGVPGDLDARSPIWTVIRQGDEWESESGETGPIRCHRCGKWLDGPSDETLRSTEEDRT